MNTLQVNNPFDGQLIKEIPMLGGEEVQLAMVKASKLFQDRMQWLEKYQRVDILKRIVTLMHERYDKIVHQAVVEGGKPIGDTRAEMDRALQGVELAIQHMSQMSGSEVPMGHTVGSQNRMAYTMLEPIGVVVSISAFNHPINLMIHQTIPAIAVGAPVIYKPALKTPLTALLIQEIYEEAGLPEGWCSTLICGDKEAEWLATNPRTSFLSFIGSAAVGWNLRSKLGSGTRCALEHGGVAPVIVASDAEFEVMIPAVVKGAFYHAGQVCVSVQKLFVHESILEEVIEKMTLAVRKLNIGDPLSDKTDVGPLITSEAKDRVSQWVKEAVKLGAELIAGGDQISPTCYTPTILLNPSDEALVSREEVFGPVLCLYSYTDRIEAIAAANSLDYAFQSAVFTKNMDVALDTVRRLNSTAVMINDHTAFRVDWMPFGGRDKSGLGLGSIPHTMKDMTREKMMVIKSRVL